ncbi:hypothetical protein HW132_13625 [Brasilonema sp. CT11]|nr:hypothetical protein [Brasilonema sp. CT11]
MNKPLNEALSIETAQRVKSKPKTPFDNAYRAALATEGAIYVQGFLVFAGKPHKPIEHGWMELEDCIVDPTLPYLNKNAQELCYFTAQRLTVKELKAIIEESKEDYPEDDPLPIYGEPPYEYYGNVMLGAKDYLEAYQAAEAKCRELNQKNADKN